MARWSEASYAGVMPGKQIDRGRARAAVATAKENPVITAVAVAPFVLGCGAIWFVFGPLAAIVLVILLGVGGAFGGKFVR